MIKYKDFYLELENELENINFVFSDREDKTEWVWKINSKNRTIEQAFQIVEREILETKEYNNGR